MKERQVVVTLVQEGFKDDYFCVDGESNARWCVYRHWSVSRESG